MDDYQPVKNKQEQLRLYSKVNNMCEKCKNLGLITAKSRDNGFEYSFRCNCNAGAIIGPGYPIWDEALYDRYDRKEIS